MARKEFKIPEISISNPFYRDEDSPPHKTPRWLRFMIPNPGTIVLLLLLLAVPTVRAGVLGGPLTAPAAAPSSATSINYQGRLFDQGTGNPITGAVNLEFVIYDAATGGNVIWGPEAHNSVTVNDGLFDVALGDTIPLSPSLFGQDRWLETTVGGETLSPRQQLLSVPVAQYAFQAEFALQAEEAMGVPPGSVGSTELAPTIYAADSGGIDAPLTSSRDPYLTVNIDASSAELYLVTWEVRAMAPSDSGRIPFNLIRDYAEAGGVDSELINRIVDDVYVSIPEAGLDGNATISQTTVIRLTPLVSHTLTIAGHNGGFQSTIRRARLHIIPLMLNNDTSCTASTHGHSTNVECFLYNSFAP